MVSPQPYKHKLPLLANDHSAKQHHHYHFALWLQSHVTGEGFCQGCYVIVVVVVMVMVMVVVITGMVCHHHCHCHCYQVISLFFHLCGQQFNVAIAIAISIGRMFNRAQQTPFIVLDMRQNKDSHVHQAKAGGFLKEVCGASTMRGNVGRKVAFEGGGVR